jgi:hypothetical protein
MDATEEDGSAVSVWFPGVLEPAKRFLARLIGAHEWQERTPMPLRPISRAEVPAAAWSALEQACGSLSLERLLVIPGTGKRAWIGGQLAMHTRVVAFGSDAVGHWTEDGGAGSVERMPVGELLAIDDRVVLLLGRLSLIGKNGQMAVRYNAVARPLIRESIVWLRRRIAGSAFPTRPSFVWIGADGDDRSDRQLPHKWEYILNGRDDLRIDPPADEMVAAGDVVEGKLFRDGPVTGIAVLGPRELLIAAEPPTDASTPRYGVDLTAVPRDHLRDVGWSGGNLRIRLRADEDADPDPFGSPADPPAISRPLDVRLFEAMRVSFGDAVEWAEP